MKNRFWALLALVALLKADYPGWRELLAHPLRVPVVAAADRARGARLLTGLGGPGAPEGARRWIREIGVIAPLEGIREDRHSMSRTLASQSAAVLGLPPAFARPRRRSPREGSGIGPALRGLAAARGTTLRRLVRRTDSH